jgi:hypothetical protein
MLVMIVHSIMPVTTITVHTTPTTTQTGLYKLPDTKLQECVTHLRVLAQQKAIWLMVSCSG